VADAGTASARFFGRAGYYATGSPVSALRTIEIILGLHPMTVFDAAAKPMFDAFANSPTPAQ